MPERCGWCLTLEAGTLVTTVINLALSADVLKA